ncbi:UNVERIFIED_CONTAM: hypothetical protein FKN15_008567 [Acipenser sinensis]
MVSEGDSAASCQSKVRSLRRDRRSKRLKFFGGDKGRPQVTLRGCRRRWMEPLSLKALRWSREIPNVSEAEEGPSPRAAEGGVPVLDAGEGGAGETACPEASGRNCLPSVSEGGPVVRGKSSQKETGQSSGAEPREGTLGLGGKRG